MRPRWLDKPTYRRHGRPLRLSNNRREEAEMRALFQWADVKANSDSRFSPLSMLFHVPNERANEKERMRLADLGVKPGVPDLCLPYASREFHSCWIELKAPRPHGKEPTPLQKIWLDQLEIAGNFAMCCWGWVEASKVLEWYLIRENADLERKCTIRQTSSRFSSVA